MFSILLVYFWLSKLYGENIWVLWDYYFWEWFYLLTFIKELANTVFMEAAENYYYSVVN